MELRYKGTFKRDFETTNRAIVAAVHEAVINIKKTKNITEIQNLVKLKKYKVHYRIRIAGDYRIGVIIRGNTVWFARFGHRNNFYKKFP
ncbi:MAG: hypothetical protein IIA88_02880 [Bacteroidetes bacterium]|nr:hypothetical protein [Bacteroidota bacterium]